MDAACSVRVSDNFRRAHALDDEPRKLEGQHASGTLSIIVSCVLRLTFMAASAASYCVGLRRRPASSRPRRGKPRSCRDLGLVQRFAAFPMNITICLLTSSLSDTFPLTYNYCSSRTNANISNADKRQSADRSRRSSVQTGTVE